MQNRGLWSRAPNVEWRQNGATFDITTTSRFTSWRIHTLNRLWTSSQHCGKMILKNICFLINIFFCLYFWEEVLFTLFTFSDYCPYFCRHVYHNVSAVVRSGLLQVVGMLNLTLYFTYMIDSLSIAVHAFVSRVSMSFSVDETLLSR